MNTVINTNMAAIRTHGVYNRNNTAMNAAMTKVATGLKINSAQDNASGYAITEKMRERIRALDQANQNTQNDTAMMKTAEGALSNTVSILTTLRERAIDSANDSNTDTDRAKIQTEVKELLKQIDTNADVKYNGKTLIDGSNANRSATKSVLFNSTMTADATIVSKDTTAVTDGAWYRVSYTKDGSTVNQAGVEITNSKKLSDILSSASSDFNAAFVSSGDSLGNDENGDAVSAGSNGLAITGANSGSANAISAIKIQRSTDTSDGTDGTWSNVSLFGSFTSVIDAGDAVAGKALNFRIGEDVDIEVNLGNMKAAGLGISSIDVSTKDNAIAAVDTIETALETALKQQTKIGALESRLGYASDNLTTARENVEASASTIADSDIAKEMTNYMRYAVLSQASQYMLSQASQNAFSVLNLLQA